MVLTHECLVTGLCFRQKFPPHPSLFISRVPECDEITEDLLNINCLRNCSNDNETDADASFLTNFGKSMVSLNEWKDSGVTKHFSDFITAGLEAFAVVCYEQKYHQWMKLYGETRDSDDEQPDQRSASKNIPQYFVQCGGWTNSGYARYNLVCALLKHQRKLPTNRSFDNKIMDKIQDISAPNLVKRYCQQATPVNDLDDLFENAF